MTLAVLPSITATQELVVPKVDTDHLTHDAFSFGRWPSEPLSGVSARASLLTAPQMDPLVERIPSFRLFARRPRNLVSRRASPGI